MSVYIQAYPTHVEVDDNTVLIWTDGSELAELHLCFGTHGNPDGQVRLSRFVAALVDGVTGGTGGKVSLKEEQ